ncbi:MAG: hypothetical protein DRJ96_10055 [Thermoprotei archaeon]|nr:hypothetical protein [Thermoproteales archaeon]RLE93504.1 MAG: hypothetical protein DRJ96_10055 [Thermoprotei archaeon]
MGRRKSRRKIRLRPKRTLPKIYQCPRCGAVAVSVAIDKSEKQVYVRCAACGLTGTLEYREYYHPVDYYAKFLDMYEEQVAASEGA